MYNCESSPSQTITPQCIIAFEPHGNADTVKLLHVCVMTVASTRVPLRFEGTASEALESGSVVSMPWGEFVPYTKSLLSVVAATPWIVPCVV